MLRSWQVFSVLLWLAATLMGFFYPATEHGLGAVQRLFYIHFGTFYAAFWLLLLAVLAGAAYLRSRRLHWDYLERACLEVGLCFLTITIVTGIYIARPAWGVYWAWDPRLTSVAIMWLTYLAYFFLRAGIDAPDLRRRLAAVYAMLAFAAVILSLLTLHTGSNLTDPMLDFRSPSLGMSPRIGHTIWANILAYIALGGSLVGALLRLAQRQEALAQRRLALVEAYE